MGGTKMKQNVIVETKDGKVKYQFDKCIACSYHDFCYLDNDGHHHKGVPNGLCEECLTD